MVSVVFWKLPCPQDVEAAIIPGTPPQGGQSRMFSREVGLPWPFLTVELHPGAAPDHVLARTSHEVPGAGMAWQAPFTFHAAIFFFFFFCGLRSPLFYRPTTEK
jgi:hypothetical protein